MLRYPHIDPIALQLGPVRIHWYGIMYLLGFAAGWWLARRRAARAGSTWTATDVDDVVFNAMLGVILGGRVGYVLFYGLSMWREDPWYPIRIWDGGMSFHGGLLGVLVGVAIFAWRRRRRVWDVFDFTAPLPCLGLFFGRIGNFINNELWGSVTAGPFGMLVEDPATGQVVARHPTQLYEATLEGLVSFAILWWFTARPRPRYAPSGLFLVCYSLARIAVEFVRVPDVQIGYFAGDWLTMGQLLSLPMLLVGVALLVIAWRRREPSGNFAGS